ncbi:MAG: alanine racemase [Bacteroidales bacterium]|nr:alanine racemase [Bacteroidales bacterium]MCF6342750.1 alanine racemase [Bacteroidales bacterium]
MRKKPELIINQNKLSRNIDRMLAKARKSRAIFRPHFKTHQSLEIGKVFREKGIDKITVSSVSMAEFFAKDGWDDITIAFPVNLLEMKEINKLAADIQLNLLVDSQYSASVLASGPENKVGVFVEIDTGYHRSGLLPDDPEIDAIVRLVSASGKLGFKGFLTHAGHTYSARGKQAVLSIMEDARQKLNDLKAKYIGQFPELIASYGDTPSCSMADDCSGFDEVRPGNFVFCDVMQYHIGSCSLDDIAVAVACPVVSVYPDRNEIIIYGGAVHLSKEFIAADNGFKLFGYVAELTEGGWGAPIPGAYVSSLSQEHGIVKTPKQFIGKFKPGDVVGILPVHSCLVADLLRPNLNK